MTTTFPLYKLLGYFERTEQPTFLVADLYKLINLLEKEYPSYIISPEKISEGGLFFKNINAIDEYTSIRFGGNKKHYPYIHSENWTIYFNEPKEIIYSLEHKNLSLFIKSSNKHFKTSPIKKCMKQLGYKLRRS